MVSKRYLAENPGPDSKFPGWCATELVKNKVISRDNKEYKLVLDILGALLYIKIKSF